MTTFASPRKPSTAASCSPPRAVVERCRRRCGARERPFAEVLQVVAGGPVTSRVTDPLHRPRRAGRGEPSSPRPLVALAVAELDASGANAAFAAGRRVGTVRRREEALSSLTARRGGVDGSPGPAVAGARRSRACPHRAWTRPRWSTVVGPSARRRCAEVLVAVGRTAEASASPTTGSPRRGRPRPSGPRRAEVIGHRGPRRSRPLGRWCWRTCRRRGRRRRRVAAQLATPIAPLDRQSERISRAARHRYAPAPWLASARRRPRPTKRSPASSTRSAIVHVAAAAAACTGRGGCSSTPPRPSSSSTTDALADLQARRPHSTSMPSLTAPCRRGRRCCSSTWKTSSCRGGDRRRAPHHGRRRPSDARPRPRAVSRRVLRARGRGRIRARRAAAADVLRRSVGGRFADHERVIVVARRVSAGAPVPPARAARRDGHWRRPRLCPTRRRPPSCPPSPRRHARDVLGAELIRRTAGGPG